MVTLVLTNVIASKLFEVPVPEAFQTITGGATLTPTAGRVTYPITFLLMDTVAEIWGQRRAAFMVYAGFFMSFVMMAVLWIAVALPPAAAWTYPAYATAQESQLAYEATFSAPGVLVMASTTAPWPSSSTSGFTTSGGGSPAASTCGCATTVPRGSASWWTRSS